MQKYNNFTKCVIDSLLHQEKENHRIIRIVQPEVNEVSDEKSHLLVLPYAGQKREKLINQWKQPQNTVYQTTWLRSQHIQQVS